MANSTFYESRAWKRKRKKVLKRDKYLCQDCIRYGRKVPATMVHHIEFYEVAPEKGLDETNLISLCEACHNKRHPEKGGRTKR